MTVLNVRNAFYSKKNLPSLKQYRKALNSVIMHSGYTEQLQKLEPPCVTKQMGIQIHEMTD